MRLMNGEEPEEEAIPVEDKQFAEQYVPLPSENITSGFGVCYGHMCYLV